MNKENNYKKYFKIQVGSPKVNGAPVLVDKSQSPGKCIESLTGAYNIKYVRGENPHYLFFESSYQIPKDIVADSPGASLADTVMSVKIGKDSKEAILKAIINEEGDLKVIENKNTIFISLIDKEQADDMVKEDNNWKKLQAWV